MSPGQHSVTASEPVLVVGAGPVGMVLACDLLRQQIPVRIIDAAPSTTVHSRAVIMWPRSLELMRRIGVADELSRTGKHIDAVSYYSGSRRLGAIEMSRLDDTPYPYGLCTPQWKTEDVIRKRLVELGGHVESETSLVGLDNSGDRPAATLRRPDGTTEEMRASWLIGADGSHSAVRRLLGIEFQGQGADVLFAIGDGPLDGPLPPDEMVYCYNAGGAMGLAPFGDGTFRVACSVPVWNDEDAPPRELFQENLDRVVPFPAKLGELKWTTVFRARRRTAATFRSGRCFLVGDAAHIFSAAGSQGMNTGIQDAVNLGWKLGGLIRGTLDARVLHSYDPERRHSAERVSLVTAKQTSWGLVQQPAKVALRDTFVRGAGVTGAFQRLVAPLMSQLTVNYASDRENVKADISWRLRPLGVGERLPVFVPDGDEDAGHSAWPTVADDRLTVLAWAGGSRGVRWEERCATLRAALAPHHPVRDVSAWPALKKFLGSAPRAVVVRPDGHIAAIDPRLDPVRLRRTLARVGASVTADTDAVIG
ncbi:FAD-dependent monooxygenase [Streptomyces sp. NPDC047108]|uniref:FAD-dependent monooxygenase n=1 Tax=Streptomyces sp. NPDC047108 TaxID=3155025 RepID=UPI003401831F